MTSYWTWGSFNRVSRDLKGSLKGEIEIDVDVEVEVEVDVDIDIYVGCLNRISKSAGNVQCRRSSFGTDVANSETSSPVSRKVVSHREQAQGYNRKRRNPAKLWETRPHATVFNIKPYHVETLSLTQPSGGIM